MLLAVERTPMTVHATGPLPCGTLGADVTPLFITPFHILSSSIAGTSSWQHLAHSCCLLGFNMSAIFTCGPADAVCFPSCLLPPFTRPTPASRLRPLPQPSQQSTPPLSQQRPPAEWWGPRPSPHLSPQQPPQSPPRAVVWVVLTVSPPAVSASAAAAPAAAAVMVAPLGLLATCQPASSPHRLS